LQDTPLAARDLARGTFVLVTETYLDVPLFWQCWKLDSPLIKTITDTVKAAAEGLSRHRKAL
jgi:LysR family transcriptional regulator, chromosome initiation inhibitor